MTDVVNDRRTPLEEIADLLLVARGLTVQDGDPVLTLQIEIALLHVARRLAGGRATQDASAQDAEHFEP